MEDWIFIETNLTSRKMSRYKTDLLYFLRFILYVVLGFSHKLKKKIIKFHLLSLINILFCLFDFNELKE